MSEQNEDLVRGAYAAYRQGDITSMLALIHPELEWTYLNSAFEDPEPETCHGREQLQWALERQAERAARTEVEEITSSGDKVMVVTRTPGIDQIRTRQADDRNYTVLTLRQGQVVAMRACRDREEARAFAGLTERW
jgi:ketosteroid isomerase-like protein